MEKQTRKARWNRLRRKFAHPVNKEPEGNGNKGRAVPNKKNFSLVSVIFCAIFVVYMIQYEETDVHFFSPSSVRRILSEETFYSTEDPPENPTNSCTPRHNLVFLKTHKCASSSIQNIFNRYGYRKGLTFVLPAKGKHQKPPGFYEKRMGGKIGFNQMLFDLGMDDKAFGNNSAVMDYVRFLDSVFDLVMVRERMDESLVLLKELLCWDVDDVIVFHLNARNERFKRKLSSDLYTRLVKFNSADMILYKYFKNRLTERINDFGPERMVEAVEELRNRTRMWYNLCVQKQEFQSKVINARRYFTNKMVMAYVKKKEVNTTCDDLTTQEPIFTEKLVYRQRFMFPRPKPYRSRYRYRMHRWH
ncbi:unnamed protein product [Larinioides sclopetarius]|uniref:Galactosylceramide sulfotransferase n=1 Tax=Larinioides sclopetarius TaxID=280406 RepID=A0AAV1ZE63_9ARAC